MNILVYVLASAGLASAATAGAWSQCGGTGYTGPTSCASGFYCIFLSSAYSLCEPWNGQLSEGLPQQPSTMQTVASPNPSLQTPINPVGKSTAKSSTAKSSSTKHSKSASSTVTVTTTIPATSTSSSTSAAATTTSTPAMTTSSSTAAAPTTSTGSNKSSSTSGSNAASTTVSMTTSVSTSQSTSSNSPSASAGLGNGQYLGRVNPSTGELSWPGTGLRFSYNGNAVIQLTATGSNSGDLIIDGTTTVIPTVTTDIPLPTGQHSIEFRKRSEAVYGSLFVQKGGSPISSNRLIEFIGDSITVGYGLDGNNPSCTNNAQVEDNPNTYAALAAKSLGADYNVAAWSGKGILRNYPGDNGPLMSELWTRYGANDADNSYTFPSQAQVVVINLGTNDFVSSGRDSLNLNAYQTAMTNFIGTVQGKYSQATFFLMSSPMLAGDQHTQMATALQNVASSTGAHFVDWPAQGSAMGCGYHPNAATHASEAPVLANAIQNVMGW